MKSSLPSQLLRSLWVLPRSLQVLLLLLSAEDRPGARLVKGWLRLCMERDFPRLPPQSGDLPSELDETSSRGLTSKLMCRLQTASDFKSDFPRSCTFPWTKPGSLSPPWFGSIPDPTTTTGPRLASSATTPSAILCGTGSTGQRRWAGCITGGSWRVKLPVEGGGRSGMCALLGVPRVGYGLSGGSRGDGESEAVDGG